MKSVKHSLNSIVNLFSAAFQFFMNILSRAIFPTLLFIIASIVTSSVISDKSFAALLPASYKSEINNQNARSRSSMLDTDYENLDGRNKNKLFSLFDPLYVVKGQATDCSFVSAFMLMVNHDPDYPYKILTFDGDSYSVKYPGLKEAIKVSEKELEKFYKTIEASQIGTNFKKMGYTPKGMEILRAAYYNYQRKKGLRPPQYKVYGGGQPIQDLMILSGISDGGKIIAVQGYTQIPAEQISFANGIEQKVRVKLQEGVFIYKNDGYSDDILDPFSVLCNDLSSYLISVSSVRKIGFFANLLGKQIVENHAYFFLGFDQEGNYILGDSYNTKEPVRIGKQEFLEKFNAIYYVRIKTE